MLFRFRKAKAVRAGIVAPSHLLLKFGKLTTKFELLCKETESPQLQNFVGEARDTRGGRVVWRAMGRARKSKRATADRDRYGVREWMRGAVGERKSAGGAQRGYGRCGGCAGDLCAGDVCTADAGADGRRDGCGANGSRRTQKQGCRMAALFAIYI